MGFLFVFRVLLLVVLSFVQFVQEGPLILPLVFFSFSCLFYLSCICSYINIFFFVSDKKKKKRASFVLEIHPVRFCTSIFRRGSPNYGIFFYRLNLLFSFFFFLLDCVELETNGLQVVPMFCIYTRFSEDPLNCRKIANAHIIDLDKIHQHLLVIVSTHRHHSHNLSHSQLLFFFNSFFLFQIW